MYLRFLPQDEYVESFKSRGQVVPPFIGLMPYAIRNGVEGYMVPCQPDHEDAEQWPDDKAKWPKQPTDWIKPPTKWLEEGKLP